MTPEQQYNPKAEQEALEAQFLSLTASPEEGLEKLRGKSDPASTRRKLVILLKSKRHTEAVEEIRGRVADEQWSELAIQALCLNGEIDEAEKVFQASRKFENHIKAQKCAMSFAEGLFLHALKNRPSTFPVLPQSLQQQEASSLRRAMDVLAPLLSEIKGIQRVDSEFEQRVCELGLKIAYLSLDLPACVWISRVLATRTPAPLLLAEARLRHWINEVPQDFPARLLNEHTRSFDAGLLAAGLQSELSKPEEAFKIAKELIPAAKAREDKIRLCYLLQDLANQLGQEVRQFVEAQAPKLLAGDEFHLALWTAKTRLQSGDLLTARAALERVANENDLQWLQLSAQLKLLSGEGVKGLQAMKRAAELFPHPDLYGRAAEIALSLNRLPDAIGLLSQQLSLEPDNVKARVRLAFAFLNGEDYDKAAEEFARSRQEQPDEIAHAFNQALSLQLSGKIDASLSILESLCTLKDPPLQVLVARAEMLKAKNKAESGFSGLKQVKERYWDDPGFVQVFMDLAHAAQEDRAAHEALVRLQDLQRQGKVQDAIWAVSFDEVKGRLQDSQRRKEELLGLSLEGKVPWLLIEDFLGRVPHWGWYLRTQPMNWLTEVALIRAEYSIYSTNCFRVGSNGDRHRTLEEIGCPAMESPVATDLSALMTLDQLGLLDHAARYFGSLFIPSSYAARVLEESSRLVLHQKSQKSSLEQIKQALETGRMIAQEQTAEEPLQQLAYVHEYSLETEAGHFYRLRDVLEVLRSTGQISDTKYNEALAAAHKPAGADDTHPALTLAQRVLIDLSTLRTLHSFDTLQQVLSSFEVRITQEDRDEVLREMRGFEAFDRAYKWHSEMWERIRSHKRIIQVPQGEGLLRKRGVEASEREIYLSAFHLARERKLPLMADDRVCQTVALNERPGFTCSAFGTDMLLPALRAAGLIQDEQLANAFLQIISWRYRFIVIPSEVLLYFAKLHLSNLPGSPLRAIARYVHDCMQDPGLFSGFEPTNPPTTMATRLFYKWATVASELVMDLWSDEAVAEERAETITRWAVRELLPSPPRTMAFPAAEVLASLLPRIVLGHALLYSGKLTDHRRANKGLLCIATAMGVTQLEYCKVLTETIDGIRNIRD
jgi:tetratricopeptide (TPR) repeat protein